MRKFFLIVLMAISAGTVFGEFEILYEDSVYVAVRPGERADFEFYVVERSRSIDTLNIQLYKELPDEWGATACTPWECFFDHATYVLTGPDSAQFSAHFVTTESSIGTGIMTMVFTNAHTGYADSVIFVVSTCDGIGSSYEPVAFEFEAYPNPFNSACRLQVPPGASVEVVNSMGKMVFSAVGSSGGFIEWVPENLPSGTYLLMVQKNGTVRTGKIIYLH